VKGLNVEYVGIKTSVVKNHKPFASSVEGKRAAEACVFSSNIIYEVFDFYELMKNLIEQKKLDRCASSLITEIRKMIFLGLIL
jgi:hypothetical protein